MATPSSPPGLARFRALWERHRRALTGLYLAALAGMLAIMFVPFLRGAVAERTQSALQSVQRGWIDRVERGEALVGAGLPEEAITYLEDLDARFPARVNRHSLDKERERILSALGQSYEAMGRKRLALETYRRAVGFDPRNVANHFALAAAALRLDEAEEAELHLEHVLSIDPSHLAALGALIGLDFERGDFERVVSRFESYLSAFRVYEEMEMRLGDAVLRVSVPVDGRARTVRVPLPRVDGATSLEFEHDQPGIEILGVELELRPRAGVVESTRRPAPREGDGLRFALPAAPEEVAAARLTVRTRVPVDPETWERVATSYRNRLDFDGLAAVEERTLRITPETGPEPTGEAEAVPSGGGR